MRSDSSFNQPLTHGSNNCCFSHSAHWLPIRKKTTLHGDQSRSWSTEQEKKKKKKKVWQRPSPPRAARSEKIRNKKITRRIHMSRRYANRRHAGGLGPSRVRTRIPTTRRLGQWVSLRKILRFRVRFQLSQSRCLSLLLAMSSMRRRSEVTVSVGIFLLRMLERYHEIIISCLRHRPVQSHGSSAKRPTRAHSPG